MNQDFGEQPMIEHAPPAGGGAPAAGTGDDRPADGALADKLRGLPKEVGVMLVSVGALGIVLPGIMGAPAMIAGGLVLWPGAFGRVESWFERRWPKAHQEGLKQIGRYLSDLEKRYPTRP
jgi:hypothetical protein